MGTSNKTNLFLQSGSTKEKCDDDGLPILDKDASDLWSAAVIDAETGKLWFQYY